MPADHVPTTGAAAETSTEIASEITTEITPVTPPESLPYARITTWLTVILAGAVVLAWLLLTPRGVLGKADAVGYAICHRIEERTFHYHDRPLPLCARCTGIYLGVMTGLVTFAVRGRLRAARLPRLPLIAVLLLPGVAIGIDGFNSYLSLFDSYQPPYQPHNTLRLVTGMYAGLTMITLVLPVYNAILWQRPQPQPPVYNMLDILLLYGIAALVIGAVLVEVPLLLLVAGLVSTVGVLLMFFVVGSTLFLTLTRRENTLLGWRDLALPAVAGIGFAVLLVGSIDALRYFFVGSWDGFDLSQFQ
ncbi:MAG: DUF2085 domain-containing protein [Chloroflexi bacterium]|nr:DUF2085 domain-containing protein [Chloroflexota bacterium]